MFQNYGKTYISLFQNCGKIYISLKRSRDVDTAYMISPKNLKKEGKITYLPTYMTGFI